jgi:hypothetical protein
MILASLRRVAANLFAIGATAALLSACTLSSATNLVDPAEAVTPLPANFAMTSYSDDDGLTKGDDAPATFALADKGYAASDGSLTVYFVPLADSTDSYLAAVASADGVIYGVARIRGDIMELAVVYSEDASAQLANAGEALPSGATPGEDSGGGIIVADRAALDAMIALHRAGKVKLTALVSWVGASEAPATLKRDGDWYVPG